MNPTNPIVEDLWQMANWAFTSQPGFVPGSLQQPNTVSPEVRTRLLNNLASLKNGVTQQMVETIRADIRLCVASGWMAADFGGTMQDMLDQLNA